ncbi:hypothetical protein STENM223S_08995 [Streptomyces tendae]
MTRKAPTRGLSRLRPAMPGSWNRPLGPPTSRQAVTQPDDEGVRGLRWQAEDREDRSASGMPDRSAPWMCQRSLDYV